MRTALLSWCLVVCSVLPSLSCRGGDAPRDVQAGGALYACPMHPAVVQGHPGDCPICGMDLVFARQAPKAPAGAGGAAHVEGAPVRAPGTAPVTAGIAASAEQQKVIGVVVSEVRTGTATRALRLVGRVVPDEARVYRVNAGIGGSIRELVAATTGSRVRKGQVIGTFWAPDALSMIQLFISNVQGRDRALIRVTEGSVEGQGVGLTYSNLQQRTQQLENIGVSIEQREEIARTLKMPDTIQIRSPAEGFVLERKVSEGQKFDRGEELFVVADLRRVWVVADVFLHEARHVHAGMQAQVSVPEQQRTLPAKVTQVLPQFDAATRTLKVRLEVENKDLALRPDMFVDVGLSLELPAGVVVPADAIVDSGLATVVFVQTGDGTFEPRRVETGWRSGDRVEVVKGLSAGERVVTSGAFFLDSETRLRSPTSGAAAAGDLAPVPTGHERPPGGAGPPPDRPATPRHEEGHGDAHDAGRLGHTGGHVDPAGAAQARADDAR